MSIRSVGVCLRPDSPEAAETVGELLQWLEERGVDTRGDHACAALSGRAGLSHEELAKQVDLLIVLGGDGTLLGVARAAGTRRVPILGINLGTLGYLTEVNVDEMFGALERVLAGDFEVRSRGRLEVSVLRTGAEAGDEQDGDVAARFLALNDAVFATRRAQMVDFDTFADGQPVTRYHADGLIVSTPTGSTAYSLSAGGPVILPGSEVVLLTPICPHTLTQRPIALRDDVTLEVVVRSSEATLSVDGQEELELRRDDRVRLRKSPHPVDIVASPFHDRFEILRTKLRWGER